MQKFHLIIASFMEKLIKFIACIVLLSSCSNEAPDIKDDTTDIIAKNFDKRSVEDALDLAEQYDFPNLISAYIIR